MKNSINIPAARSASPLCTSAALLIGALCAFNAASAQTVIAPHPVSDISKQAANSDVADINQVDNKLYFTATDKKGRALYVKTFKRNANTQRPALDATANVVTRFKAGVMPDQFVVTGMEDLASTFRYAQLYFHVPKFGLYHGGMPVKKTDFGKNNNDQRWLSSLAPFKNDARYDTRFRAVRLFFAGDDPKKGHELFISNGTKKGTKVFANIGKPDFFPYGMVDCNGTLFFGGSGQLWKSGGTVASTALVTTDQTISPLLLTPSSTSGCFFSGSVRSDGTRDLFHSDGTPNGTVALTSNGSFPYEMTPFGGGMILAEFSTAHGFELYYTDNSQTYELNDINPSGSSVPEHLTNAGDEQVYFTANDSLGTKLYRTNGNPSSLTEVRSQQNASMLDVSEIVPLFLNNNGQAIGDRVYFTTGANHALWFVENSDGSAVAYPVLTGQNHQVINAINLAKFVDNAVYRLYFNTDGAGTEFAGKGTELWTVGYEL